MTTTRTKTALVTGANRGLGRETCRQLADQTFHVVLTARDTNAARHAADELSVDHLQLDVTNSKSIMRAAAECQTRYGQIDALINNAGVYVQDVSVRSAMATIAVNTVGAMDVTDAFMPLLSEHGTIVMVSSGLGELSYLSPGLRAEFEAPDLSRDRLKELMQSFVRTVGEGTHRAAGWPESAYNVSKAGLNAFTRLLARELTTTGVHLNAVCPGWVRTDMGGEAASRSVEEGARGIVWAAMLNNHAPSGGFFRDGKEIPW